MGVCVQVLPACPIVGVGAEDRLRKGRLEGMALAELAESPTVPHRAPGQSLRVVNPEQADHVPEHLDVLKNG